MVLDTGHTAFILICMALVQLMLPGLAFFYAGLLQANSVITMIMQNFACMGVVTVLWFLGGFSLCFGGMSALDTLASQAYVGLYPIVTLEKKATEYDRKPGIKWLSCATK